MKTKNIFLSILVSGLFSSCMDDFLNLEPMDQVTDAVYYTTLEEFQNSANYLHSKDNLYAFKGNSGYNVGFDYGTDIVKASSDELNGTNSTGTASEYWENPYKWLRKANELIEEGENYTGTDDISTPLGQAYFFRAWHHFWLLKRFGGIPLMTSVPTVSSPIITGPRNSRYEVIASVLSDLDKAIGLLNKTTKASTKNDGQITKEAATALKARVCLYEGTFEKYNADNLSKLDGDGVKEGAGSAKPSDYPSVTKLLEMAKECAAKFVSGGEFANEYELFAGVESADKPYSKMYEHKSYYYLFTLENGSNPNGLNKADNNEAIFRTVYDATLGNINTNLSHTHPSIPTRKLRDMFLCSDGLPIQHSSAFKGFEGLNTELENRDYRMTSVIPAYGAWCWGKSYDQTGAQYDVDITTLSPVVYQFWMTLAGGDGLEGYKWHSEGVATSEYNTGQDYMHIRLPEMLLCYAEATCELGNGAISEADLDKSVNVVRARAGVAPLTAGLIASYSDLSLLGEIRREYATEFYGEGRRLADLTRWGQAVTALKAKNDCGLYVYYKGQQTAICSTINPKTGEPIVNLSMYPSNDSKMINQNKITYEYSGYASTEPGAVIISGRDANARQFDLRNYFQPIPTDQIKLNPALAQNPGW